MCQMFTKQKQNKSPTYEEHTLWEYIIASRLAGKSCKQKKIMVTLLSILYCVLLFIFVILNIQSDHQYMQPLTLLEAGNWKLLPSTTIRGYQRSYWKLQDVFKTRMICKNSLSLSLIMTTLIRFVLTERRNKTHQERNTWDHE